MALFQHGLVNPAQQLAGLMNFSRRGAFWHHAQNVFRADDRHQPDLPLRLRVEKEHLTAGLPAARALTQTVGPAMLNISMQVYIILTGMLCSDNSSTFTVLTDVLGRNAGF